MTTLTPEELAAYRKEFEEFSLGKLSLVTHPADPAMYSSELTNFAFTVWQSARSKSAKEIASLKDKLFLAQKETSILRSWLGKNK